MILIQFFEIIKNMIYRKYIKRLLDILFGIIGFVICSVLFIVLGPIIYFNDKGPIIYVSKRIGENGKLFNMFKFRSMMVNAPDIRLSDGSTYNGDDDPRVTTIGRFMRKTSLDEFPQFINVLLGNMSLVGPRPDPPDWLDKYPEDVKIFLTVKPGITGFNQAYYRNSNDGIEKMKNDVFYAKNISFWLDIKIFFKTIITVLKKENTYKAKE